MTPDLSLLSGFTRGVLLSLHVRDTCLHSGSWLLSGLILHHCTAFLAPVILTNVSAAPPNEVCASVNSEHLIVSQKKGTPM